MNAPKTELSPPPKRQLLPHESTAVSELLITLHGKVTVLPKDKHMQAHLLIGSAAMRDCAERLVVTTTFIASQHGLTGRVVRQTQQQSFITAMFGESLMILFALECTPDEDGYISSSRATHAAFNALVACVENRLSQEVRADQHVVHTLAKCLVNQPLFFGLCTAIGECRRDV